MNCEEFQERIAEYRDLEPEDPIRARMDDHVRTCPACAEELGIWKSSWDLIRDVRPYGEFRPEPDVSRRVMSRIYEDESWRIPIASKQYTFTYFMRRNYMACIAFFLALFVAAMIHALLVGHDPAAAAVSDASGIVPAANAQGADTLALGDAGNFEGIPVASITAPRLLTVAQLPQSPNYWFAVSLFGMIGALLIMNWLSRTRN